MLLAGDPALAARYRERFGFVAVDEYQDVDELQYRLLRLLVDARRQPLRDRRPGPGDLRLPRRRRRLLPPLRRGLPGAPPRPADPQLPLQPGHRRRGAPGDRPHALVAGRELARHGRPGGPDPDRRPPGGQRPPRPSSWSHTIDRLLGGASYLSLDSGRADGGAEHELSFADVAVLYRTDAQAGPLSRRWGGPGCRSRSARTTACSTARPSGPWSAASATPAPDGRRRRRPGPRHAAAGREAARWRARLAGRRGRGRRRREAVEALGPARPPGRALRRRPRPLPRRAGPRRRGRRLGPAGGQGVAAHPARGQGPGVPGRVPGRLRGRPAAAALRPPGRRPRRSPRSGGCSSSG